MKYLVQSFISPPISAFGIISALTSKDRFLWVFERKISFHIWTPPENMCQPWTDWTLAYDSIVFLMSLWDRGIDMVLLFCIVCYILRNRNFILIMSGCKLVTVFHCNEEKKWQCNARACCKLLILIIFLGYIRLIYGWSRPFTAFKNICSALARAHSHSTSDYINLL